MIALNLRTANSDDLAALFKLHQASVYQLCKEHYSEAQLQHWFDDRDQSMYQIGVLAQKIWVAEDTEIQGFIEMDQNNVIDKLFINPTAAKSGVGSLLLHHAFAWLTEQGVTFTQIESTVTAQFFYQKHGFYPLKTAYFSKSTDVAPLKIIRMQKDF